MKLKKAKFFFISFLLGIITTLLINGATYSSTCGQGEEPMGCPINITAGWPLNVYPNHWQFSILNMASNLVFWIAIYYLVIILVSFFKSRKNEVRR